MIIKSIFRAFKTSEKAPIEIFKKKKRVEKEIQKSHLFIIHGIAKLPLSNSHERTDDHKRARDPQTNRTKAGVNLPRSVEELVFVAQFAYKLRRDRRGLSGQGRRILAGWARVRMPNFTFRSIFAAPNWGYQTAKAHLRYLCKTGLKGKSETTQESVGR